MKLYIEAFYEILKGKVKPITSGVFAILRGAGNL